MNGLLMKYFVLKPAGGDAYAVASRAAMRTYAASIVGTNPDLYRELIEWIDREEAADLADFPVTKRIAEGGTR